TDDVSDGVNVVSGLVVVVRAELNETSYVPPPHGRSCPTLAAPDQKSVCNELSPEKRFVDGVVWLLRWSAVDNAGTNALFAAATRSALIAGSSRFAASAALLLSARRTVSSRVSLTTS